MVHAGGEVLSGQAQSGLAGFADEAHFLFRNLIIKHHPNQIKTSRDNTIKTLAHMINFYSMRSESREEVQTLFDFLQLELSSFWNLREF